MAFAQVDSAARTTATEAPSRERVYYFDYLRMWAACGVVLLHASSAVFAHYAKPSADLFSKFVVADFGDAAGRFGVSCFFMVSGALLLAPERSFRLGKQLRRVGIPLLVWSAVYLLYTVWLEHHDKPLLSGRAPALRVTSVVKSLLAAPYAYHLWFLYALIGLYLVFPLLRPLTALPEAQRLHLLHYALALWTLFVVLIPTVQRLWPGHLTLYSSLVPSIPAGYLGTAVLGFYLHRQLRSTPRPLLVACLAVVSASTAALVLFGLLVNDRDWGWALGNFTPWVVLYTACVFVLGKAAFNRPGRAYPFVSLFSRLSFRIYLVHALVLHVLTQLSPMRSWYLHHPVASIPTMVVLTLVISFAFAWLVEQIKPIRSYI
jgi:surface polysaccharide O-acyltransferase-like enzyme